MTLLVVGVSHHTAPVALLERLSVAAADTDALLGALAGQPHVDEAVVLSTCNRVEVYAGVNAFHGALAEIGSVLAERAGVDVADLVPYLYVRYDADAVRHAFRVAGGLDSMVVGEAQILGQLREAYGRAGDAETVGRLLHELMQQALRVGKRVHAETGIDRAGQSVVTAALALGAGDVAGRPALVIGAGAMGSLALATLSRAHAGPLYVANRGADRAARAAQLHGATAVAYGDLATAIADVDIVVSATASVDQVLTRDLVSAAVTGRDRPLVVLDLAVPRDVEPAVAELPGVVLVDLARLGDALIDSDAGVVDQAAAEEIVAGEVEAYLNWLRGSNVAPTVAALRARADEVVTYELRRLAQRRSDLSEEQRREVAHTVHRVVQRLLHSPTVRARQLAATPDGDQYAAVLRELFDLDVLGEDAADVGRAVGVEFLAEGGAR
ncbi:glutamyl-tRNA reductase [Luedemannella helvata]|uniref:Glutamyl-tRNA reductase n=1 Tax=Luedemannella helvata TaxID=349315 RepID=A0ABP4WXC7_9ACTN